MYGMVSINYAKIHTAEVHTTPSFLHVHALPLHNVCVCLYEPFHLVPGGLMRVDRIVDTACTPCPYIWIGNRRGLVLCFKSLNTRTTVHGNDCTGVCLVEKRPASNPVTNHNHLLNLNNHEFCERPLLYHNTCQTRWSHLMNRPIFECFMWFFLFQQERTGRLALCSADH